MVKHKKIMSVLLFLGVISAAMLSQNLRVSAAKWEVTQKKYALVAENVRNVRISGNAVFLSQKKNKVVQVELLKKLKRKDVCSKIYYKNCLISNDAKEYFPPDSFRIFSEIAGMKYYLQVRKVQNATILHIKQRRIVQKINRRLPTSFS